LAFFLGFVDPFKVDLAPFVATFGAALDPLVDLEPLVVPLVDLEHLAVAVGLFGALAVDFDGFVEPFVLPC